MKKLIFLSLIAILFVFVGCDLFCPEPPVVIKYTLEASASVGGTISPSGKMEVVKGANQTFTFMPDAGYKADYISIVNAYGSGESVVIINNTYTLSNITGNYTIKVVFKDAQLEQTLELLTKNPWKNILFQARGIGTTDWYTQTGDGFAYGIGTYIFYKDYKQQHFTNNVLTGDGPYVLKQDSLIMGSTNPDDGFSGVRFKILTLSENSLIVRLLVHYYDGYGKSVPTKDVEEQFTYIH